MKNLNNKNKGFTLIEILVVIGIIAILAAIVIVAINPKKHFDDAIAAQRDANINTILNSIGQYIVDKKGNLPPELLTTPFLGSAVEVNQDLCEELVPNYVGAIPSDPKSQSEGKAFTDCTDVDANDIKYTVETLTDDGTATGDLTGHVQVCTLLADGNGDGTASSSEQICVVR